MTKVLAIVLILGLQGAVAAENVAVKSLRLNLWYQGVEAVESNESDLMDAKKSESKREVSSDLLELAYKFSLPAESLRK